MKGKPMKEKVIITLSFAGFIGIMWLSSTIKTTNPNPAISEENTPLPIDNYSKDHIDDIFFETAVMDEIIPESDFSVVKACSLNPIETDIFKFGDAFQYYRQCLGSDSSFQWKGETYTTLLSEEVIIQVADSVQVKKDTGDHNEVTEIR